MRKIHRKKRRRGWLVQPPSTLPAVYEPRSRSVHVSDPGLPAGTSEFFFHGLQNGEAHATAYLWAAMLDDRATVFTYMHCDFLVRNDEAESKGEKMLAEPLPPEHRKLMEAYPHAWIILVYYQGFCPEDLFDLACCAPAAFKAMRQTMMSGTQIAELKSRGITPSSEMISRLREDVVKMVDEAIGPIPPTTDERTIN